LVITYFSTLLTKDISLQGSLPSVIDQTTIASF
jgi:hypothetical protein